MERTTIFLPDELRDRLREAAERTGRSQAELVRQALDNYLGSQVQPWPASFAAFESVDDEVDSSTVKTWIRERWGQAATTGTTKPGKPAPRRGSPSTSG